MQAKNPSSSHDMQTFLFKMNEYFKSLPISRFTTVCIPYFKDSRSYPDAEALQFLNSQNINLLCKLIDNSWNQADNKQQNVKTFENIEYGYGQLYLRQKDQHRYVYFSLDVVEIQTIEYATNSYKLMVEKCYLLKKMLQKTSNLKIIILSKILPQFQNSPTYQFYDLLQKNIKAFNEEFELNTKFYMNIDFFMITQSPANKIKVKQSKKMIKNQTKEQNKTITLQDVNIFVITKNQQPIYRLRRQNQNGILIQSKSNQLESNTYISCGHLDQIFYYKRFQNILKQVEDLMLQSQENIDNSYTYKLKNLDTDIAKEIYSLIPAIVNNQIYDILKKIKIQTTTKLQYSIKQIKRQQGSLSLAEIKKRCNFIQWQQSKKSIRNKKNDLQRIVQKSTKQQQSFNFQLFNPEIDQNLVFSKFMNQINKMCKIMTGIDSKIRNTSKKDVMINLQCKIKNYLIGFVKGLNTLKPHFNQILGDFQGEFLEQLVTQYMQAYEYFCYMNKAIYEKSFQLTKFLSSLSCPSKEIMQIVKTFMIREYIKQRRFQILDLQSYLNKLVQLENIMILNNTNLLSTDAEILHKKYVLSESKAIILNEIGILKQQNSQEAASYYYSALQILMDIYQKPIQSIQDILSQTKIISLQTFSYGITPILSLISKILQSLGEFKLSIEIQKSIDETLNVDKLYKKWILLHQNTDKQLFDIFQDAINYFKSVVQFQKVQQYFDLMIQKCTNYQKKKQYRMKMYEFLQWMYLPNNQQRNRLVSGLKNSKKKLNQNYKEQIIKIYKKK